MSIAPSSTNVASPKSASPLDFADGFLRRHIGPSSGEVAQMLTELGFDSLESMSDALVPSDIRLERPLDIPAPRGEFEFLNSLRSIAAKNKVYRSCIGLGFW